MLLSRQLILVMSSALFLFSCRGAQLELEFDAGAPVELASLTVLAVQDTQLPVLRFPADGGSLTLPLNVRLLVDAAPVTLTATAVDLRGGVRRAQKQVARLSPGAHETVQFDLSVVDTCPAMTPTANEVVLFDDEAHDSTAYGFVDANFSQPADGGACSGTTFAQYEMTSQFDGFGLYTAAPAALWRFSRLSLRLWASESTSVVVGFVDSSNALVGAVGAQLEPRWQELAFDVAASVPPARVINIQIIAALPHPVTVRFDDVRGVSR